MHKLGLGIAFVISMLILPVPPPSSCPRLFTYYIPVLFLSPALLTIFSIPYSFPFCSLSLFLLTLHLLPPSVLSQSIALSFLPWRQYYQCVASSSKLHSESVLELEIGVMWSWRLSCRKRRACFTHKPIDSRDSSSFLPRIEICCYLHSHILPHR